MDDKTNYTCDIGIMAYNEEKNIGLLLDALLRQKLNKVSIEKIMVVASGCTDRTEEIVKEYTKKYPKIELIIQPQRLGKASAVNLFLKKAKTPVVVLESADTFPLIETIEKLVSPFEDPRVGMAGARPMPQNDPNTFMGFTNHLLWTLHHLLSLQRPKMGELVAFRHIVTAIPENSAVDETCIESFISRKGLKILYIPEAIVINYGAENLSDFIKQRRRIYAGHLVVESNEKYKVATLHASKIFSLIFKYIKLNFKTFFWLWGAVFLEACGRYLGVYDFFIKKKSHAVWDIAESTKEIKGLDHEK